MGNSNSLWERINKKASKEIYNEMKTYIQNHLSDIKVVLAYVVTKNARMNVKNTVINDKEITYLDDDNAIVIRFDCTVVLKHRTMINRVYLECGDDIITSNGCRITRFDEDNNKFTMMYKIVCDNTSLLLPEEDDGIRILKY